ncbi:MAG: UbiA family prenyltransferase [Candidatus Moranbacteria bacterium]|nr:UbiA family prenyltransferase [Candidatus Moranbacteria bacterium]
MLPPIIDLLLTKGAGLPIGYVIIWPKLLIDQFIKTFTSISIPGITPGLHLAGLILITSVAFYIYHYSKSIFKSLIGAFIGCLIFFLYSILPSLLIISFSDKANSLAVFTYINELTSSLLFYTQNSLSGMEKLQQINFMQDIFLGQLLWIFVLIQGFFLFKKSYKNAAEIITTTVRVERIFNYFLIASIGMIISSHLFEKINFGNIANMVSIVMFFLMLGLVLVWETFINDREDIAIDKLTNTNRPLAKEIISIDDWEKISNILAILIIFGFFLINQTSTFFLVLLTASYYIYSSKPLRLKRHFISSSILIGLATVSTVMAGFFLVSHNQQIKAFPISAIFIIGIVQALLSNLKDIKDYAGDKKEGIRTIPVIFGEKKAKIIITIIYALVFIFLPFYFQFKSMLYIGILAAILIAYFLNKKHYQEKYVFLVMFMYMFFLYLSFI